MSEQPAAHDQEALHIHDPRPWLRNYPAGVPAEVQIPDSTVVDVLQDSINRFPDHNAGIYYGRKITYRELDKLSNQFANRMIELGVERGDPVLLLLPNVPQFIIAAYGILKAGGVIAAINPLLVEREIVALLRDSGAKIVVTLDRFWDRIAPIHERGEINAAIVTGAHDYLPGVKRMLYPVKFRNEMVKVPDDPSHGLYHFRDLLSGVSEDRPDVSLKPDDVFALQYTGGTTGLPKAVVLTHRNMVANSIQVRNWVPEFRDGEETVLAILPFFHSYGGALCLFLGAYIGATIVMVPRFDIGDVMEQIEKHQPTILPGVPTLYNAMVGAVKDNPKRQQAVKSINFCVSGGAPLPGEVRARFEEITGSRLVEGYGLSEASPVTHVNPLDGRGRDGTIGLPIPSTEAIIVDPETREPLAPGESGELAVRGPQVMRGYWQKLDETAEVLSESGWLYTGDIATMDDDGFFRIVDRKKDVIISSGENVYPREIEDVLLEHPKIHEVCVAAVPHGAGGEVAKAFIVVVPGETLDRREVMQFCTDKLARYKIPRLIEFRDELPKSATGKILRRKLQEEEAQKQESNA